MAINAGIIVLKDGSPCIVYDGALPHPIKHVEFCRDDFQLSLIYQLPSDKMPKDGFKFDFPLDQKFVTLLDQKKQCAAAFVKDQQMVEIKMYNVVFVDA
jgi:hypothetical protein